MYFCLDLQSDCPYVLGMGCKIKATVDNLNKKLDDLQVKIDQTNSQKIYSDTTKEVKSTIKGDETYRNNFEFKKFAMEYTKEAGERVSASSSSTMDYIMYICFFLILAFSAYVLFDKRE